MSYFCSLTPGKTLVALAGRCGCNVGGVFFKKGRPGGDINVHKLALKRSKLYKELEKGSEVDKKGLEGDQLEFFNVTSELEKGLEGDQVEFFKVTQELEKGSEGDHLKFFKAKEVFKKELHAGAEVPCKSCKNLFDPDPMVVETVANTKEAVGEETFGHAGAEVPSKPCARESKPVLVKTVCDAEEEMADKPVGDVKTSKDKTLDGIARENQDWKAVKSDDAAVPEYLWEDHLLEGLKSKNGTKLTPVYEGVCSAGGNDK
jgi:hypothetical protein